MMDRRFYVENRQALYRLLDEGSIAVFFAGHAPRKSADSAYPYFANRNFVYMTGAGDASAQGFIFMAEKYGGKVLETMFVLPPDNLAERWNGRRMKAHEVHAECGIENTAPVSEFRSRLHTAIGTGRYAKLWLDLARHTPDEPVGEALRFAREMGENYPHMRIENSLPLLRSLRTIKKPCEIEAMRKAMTITREGILAMMKASRPGMYEYEYKAAFDEALTRRGVLAPAFQSIISAGQNNFCIHYEAYTGQAQDGDMILNDVGAAWDFLCNDVSRAFPCNGRFNERQRLLYTAAYNTSEYMFGIIKPGMPMRDVDRTAREYCFLELKKIGLLDDYADIGRYMWHGGAHHVGFDVHDVVDMERDIAPGMVFCVDIGIYCEEWGIGFRLEDNCLVTEDGCENLSAEIPRSIEEIERAMNR